eukprot:CAMPEP_0174829314 /NCGR_PEP_ID=MMETSP1114-20130205/1865_1 /TAXON_ID=312471 /ORGANISM="Neobodo designis, Strain CCAP 1951/1" /LENGTH=333 /DNA_ID=CAMNT_0016063057 /DNA_START=65 /DNA_END=1066 /DNA_ORIENTATION=-
MPQKFVPVPQDVEAGDFAAKVVLASPADASRDRRDAVLIGLLTFQTGLLVTMAFAGAIAYSQVMEQASKLERLEAFVRHPVAAVKSHPEAAVALSQLVQNATTAFFLGSPDGTVSGFLEDLFETDFAGVASSIVPLATKVANKFEERQSSPDCTKYVECTQWGSLQCPNNGPTRWCDNAGQVVNCGNCPFAEAAEISSKAESVLRRVADVRTVTPVGGNNTAPAAFSDGLLRLNSVLSWVSKQGDVTSWARAARACNDLADSVDNVNWSGNYSSNGGSANWDANSQVLSVTSRARQYCSLLGELASANRALEAAKHGDHRRHHNHRAQRVQQP